MSRAVYVSLTGEIWNCVRRGFKTRALRQYNSNDQVRENDVERACIPQEREEAYIQGCGGGKKKRKEPLRRPRSRRKDNIKLDLREIG
ncbi:hypothetical protein B7P43_G06923 [Cryptotermes secundus]|uniref:Uncharacterized protein n=1 Tax=Cryptotermes secundus TaxID=105785 RepID=A0A2J7RNY7_9NEOP|nr:hypothetical protein B7P43_G06923 [Cryptotermes secundus]